MRLASERHNAKSQFWFSFHRRISIGENHTKQPRQLQSAKLATHKRREKKTRPRKGYRRSEAPDKTSDEPPDKTVRQFLAGGFAYQYGVLVVAMATLPLENSRRQSTVHNEALKKVLKGLSLARSSPSDRVELECLWL